MERPVSRYHACVPFSFSVRKEKFETRVADPSDQYGFGPPGSISQRYGSGSFYLQGKKVRKTLNPTAL
jgi:hypothetical protein